MLMCCSTKLKTEELREAHQMVTEAQWADDKQATNCAQCKKAFSVSRRKVRINRQQTAQCKKAFSVSRRKV